MEDDTREREPPSTAPVAAESSTEPPKKLPKGIILGKDGKPCRTCNSLKDMTSQSRKFTKTPTTIAPRECPPDVEQLGRSSWTLLHSITAAYPTEPTPTEQTQASTFVSLFAKLYPCWVCAEDFQDWMARNKVRTESREEFGRWMCEAHNDVNRKLGKREFDCSKWEERWRTGWKDGSCD
ncbi:uncharacterized protein L3040_003817 [Drepanopeziza brunnea f. sp. 'multigermtubi']|uniref:uncharacterized protein n=1 Tax=Drepanopeziza brunnea f. sp. 'multigermtubi' TaxID=698441 RepID=UPI00239BB9C5|nr:hypothetical protein L3040_003817 [Drepanopeziza brunnea f. sp. 'multigermtubi']